MKCVKKVLKNEDRTMFRRVSDFRAHILVTEEGWKYCPKSEWKKAGGRNDD